MKGRPSVALLHPVACRANLLAKNPEAATGCQVTALSLTIFASKLAPYMGFPGGLEQYGESPVKRLLLPLHPEVVSMKISRGFALSCLMSLAASPVFAAGFSLGDAANAISACKGATTKLPPPHRRPRRPAC
jgi:hypothetical protein